MKLPCCFEVVRWSCLVANILMTGRLFASQEQKNSCLERFSFGKLVMMLHQTLCLEEENQRKE